jgi:hypothetical protein
VRPRERGIIEREAGGLVQKDHKIEKNKRLSINYPYT